MLDICEVKKCDNLARKIWEGKRVCEYHYFMYEIGDPNTDDVDEKERKRIEIDEKKKEMELKIEENAKKYKV